MSHVTKISLGSVTFYAAIAVIWCNGTLIPLPPIAPVSDEVNISPDRDCVCRGSKVPACDVGDTLKRNCDGKGLADTARGEILEVGGSVCSGCQTLHTLG